MRIKMKQLRASKGWTQKQTAVVLDVSLDYVKSVEIGRCTPSLPMAKKIADTFGCDHIDDLIEVT